MSTQDSQRRSARPGQDEAEAEEVVLPERAPSDIDADVDAILDEIDEVLEENAEEFVKSFVQKGGQ